MKSGSFWPAVYIWAERASSVMSSGFISPAATWAKSRGLPRTAGHKKGAQVFQDIANYCDELGVESVYFYAFSTENWKRPAEEVGAIMRLFGEYLIKGFDYKNRNIRICFMGDRTALDPKLQKLMNELPRTFFQRTAPPCLLAVRIRRT